VHRRAEEINETRKQWVRQRGLKLVFDHAEVVKCDISATANTLKSQDIAATQHFGRFRSEADIRPMPAFMSTRHSAGPARSIIPRQEV